MPLVYCKHIALFSFAHANTALLIDIGERWVPFHDEVADCPVMTYDQDILMSLHMSVFSRGL